MDRSLTITFIGFGVMTATFAEALSRNGARIAAYDVLHENMEIAHNRIHHDARHPSHIHLPIVYSTTRGET